jgi:hypothetical protein
MPTILIPIKTNLESFYTMNDKIRFTLAEKIQKRIQEKHPYFQLIKRRDEIEKQLKEKKT